MFREENSSNLYVGKLKSLAVAVFGFSYIHTIFCIKDTQLKEMDITIGSVWKNIFRDFFIFSFQFVSICFIIT